MAFGIRRDGLFILRIIENLLQIAAPLSFRSKTSNRRPQNRFISMHNAIILIIISI